MRTATYHVRRLRELDWSLPSTDAGMRAIIFLLPTQWPASEPNVTEHIYD